MKFNIFLLLVFGLIIGFDAYGQKSKKAPAKKTAIKTNLINTKWEVYVSDDKTNWQGGWTLTLLSGGKVSQKWVDGSVENREADYPSVSWKLSGNRLSYKCEINCEERWTVTINGDSGQGRGSTGWKEIPMFVRLKKIN